MANSISGNAGVAGATVVIADFLNAGFLSTTADGSGNYTFSGLGAATYHLSAGKTGYTFSPNDTVQTIVSSNITGVNFTATAFTPTGVWTKYGDVNLIPPINAPSTVSGTYVGSVFWDTNPQVLVGNSRVLKTWFIDGPNTYYAESLDGISWTRKVGAVAAIVNPSCSKINGIYYLSGSTNTLNSPAVMYTSSDGINFTLQNATAITVGTGTWDNYQIAQLQIIDQVGGTWRGLYTASGGPYAGGTVYTTGVGLATSTDLINWTKTAANAGLVMFNANSPSVVKIGSIYYAWFQYIQYDASVGSTGQIFVPTDIWRAQSTDLINWTNFQPSLRRTFIGEGVGLHDGIMVNPVILAGTNGTVYMYYSGSNQGRTLQGFKTMLATANMSIQRLVTTNEGLLSSPQLAVDTFQRANENPLSGGGNWTNLGSNFQLLNNAACPAATGVFADATYSAIAWPNDQYNEATIGAMTVNNSGFPYLDLIVRYNGSIDYDLFFTSATGVSQTVTLNRGGAGPVSIGTFTATPLVGDVWRLEAVGTTINVYQNGAKVFTVTNSAVASGSPYIQARHQVSVADSTWSSWEGGSPTPAALPALPNGQSINVAAWDILFRGRLWVTRVVSGE